MSDFRVNQAVEFCLLSDKYPGKVAQREDLALPEYYVYGGQQLLFRLDHTAIPAQLAELPAMPLGAHKAQAVSLEQ